MMVYHPITAILRAPSHHAFPAVGGRMLTILDLNAEFAKLKMLRGRTPETPETDREGAFARLAPYRDSAINVAKFSGEGPWERHPNGDEIVQIVDGAVTFHIMTDDGPRSPALNSGVGGVVPPR